MSSACRTRALAAPGASAAIATAAASALPTLSCTAGDANRCFARASRTGMGHHVGVDTAYDRHVAGADIERVRDGERAGARDEVAVEEPLEIRVDGEPLAVTMRTPGEDEQLAAGFLAGEGLIDGPGDVESVGPTA